jgi:hypothetical protein
MATMAVERCIKLSPIENAPVKQGEIFGPCLLGPGNNSDWVTGWWNGHGWFADDGTLVRPRWWALLPALAAL